jgi:hypothetical protein
MHCRTAIGASRILRGYRALLGSVCTFIIRTLVVHKNHDRPRHIPPISGLVLVSSRGRVQPAIRGLPLIRNRLRRNGVAESAFPGGCRMYHIIFPRSCGIEAFFERLQRWIIVEHRLLDCRIKIPSLAVRFAVHGGLLQGWSATRNTNPPFG